jgi:hypothetical protein
MFGVDAFIVNVAIPTIAVELHASPAQIESVMMHQRERAVDVLEHADGIGDHDVVERSFDRGQRRRILDVAEHKIETGMTLFRPAQGLGAEIDADAVSWLKRGQQIASAAAQFQHPLARRNQKSHELEVVFVVGGVEFAPAFLLIEARFDFFHQLPFPRIVGLKRNGQRHRIHHGLDRRQIGSGMAAF